MAPKFKDGPMLIIIILSSIYLEAAVNETLPFYIAKAIRTTAYDPVAVFLLLLSLRVIDQVLVIPKIQRLSEGLFKCHISHPFFFQRIKGW